MGQYYKAVLLDRDGKMTVASPTKFDNGFKLMEHSWIGNNFVNAVLECLDGTPRFLAWIGDYAMDVINEEDQIGTAPRELAKKCYDYAWERETDDGVLASDAEKFDLSLENRDCFIVNNTTKEYVDMEKYIEKNKDKDGWCINPLPLLTAVGNGLGGGDYRGINDGAVGIWAFDEIYVTRICPSNYDECVFSFKE